MEENGEVKEQYEMDNREESWETFRSRYSTSGNEIALEVSTTGKFIARKLRDLGFLVHLADPSKLALIFNTAKKNDREDSYKLAKLLRLGELPEVHPPSRKSEELRSITRYRKSIGEETTMLKNRIHAILSSQGVSIDATDIFGKKGISEIEKASKILSDTDRFILSSIIDRISHLSEEMRSVEDQMARMIMGNKNVERLMTIPGINVYSAAVIMSEIDDISRFATKEKLASYAGLVPRQNQSGNRDIRGHITKHGPSMLRFILVNAAHLVIRYSKKMKSKYLSIVRRLGKNRAIVAIARNLLEIIYTMLKKGEDFVDNMDGLTERKIKSMQARSMNPGPVRKLEDLLDSVKKRKDGTKFKKKKMMGGTPKELFS
jgi:transposase